MSELNIKLGDEVEDVTAKATGVAIGRVEYLDGSKAWLIQPQYTPDGTRIPVIEVQDAYARRVGEGVYVQKKPEIGFHARSERR